jgi:hypothetical protein
MARSETPILDLQIIPPNPKKSVGVSWKGLLRAIPWAIAVIVLFFSILAAFFRANVTPPAWLQHLATPVFDAIDVVFRNGPLVAVIVLLVVELLTILIHEAGHAIAAKLFGWPILEFRVVPVSLLRQEGRWKVRLSYKEFPPGLVKAEPPNCSQFHLKLRRFALGGPAANLITAALAMICENAIPFLSAYFVIFIAFSLLHDLVNLLPVHNRNFEFDGYSAFRLTRKPALLAARIAAFKMRKHLDSGRPLSTMNRRWVALITSKQKLSLQDRSGALLTYAYWVHRRKFDSAAMMLERLLEISGDAHPDFKAFLYVECSIFCSLLKQHKAALVWRQRASEFPNLADFQLLRCDAHIASATNDIESAHRFALGAKQALLNNRDNRLRETYLKALEPWIEELAASIQSKNAGILNEPTADLTE